MRALSIVRQLLAPSLHSVHAGRQGALYAVVDALLRDGKLSLTALGRAVAGPVSAKHSIKRVDRLLGNPWMHEDLPDFYGALARAILAPHSQPILLVDWTKLDSGQWALVAAVPMSGRSIPVYSEVHPERDLGSDSVHRDFLGTLWRTVIPRTCTPIVVTDAGFQNPWFKAVTALDWDFVGRLNAGVLLAETTTTPAARKLRESWVFASVPMAAATQRAQNLGTRWVARSRPVEMRLVLTRRPPRGRKGSAKVSRAGIHPGCRAWRQAKSQATAPWLLGTSLDALDANRIVNIYARRMQIEQTFRDTKNARHGWSFEFARSRSLDRLEVLLLIAAIATFAVLLVGLAAERDGLHHRCQANTIRDRRVLSLFSLGKLVLDPATAPRDRPRIEFGLVELLRKAVPDGARSNLTQSLPG